MQVVAEVNLAVLHVVDAVEHVGMPDGVDVSGRCDFLLGMHSAELPETQVFLRGSINPGRRPVRVVAQHELCDSGQTQLWFSNERTGVHGTSPRWTNSNSAAL